MCFLLGLASAARVSAAEPEGHSSSTVKIIDFAGNRTVGKDELLNAISIQPGDPFTPEQVLYSSSAIHALYQDRGYWRVQVSTAINADETGIVLVFHINEGSQYRIRDILISGNRKINEEIIRRDLGVAEGDRFSRTALYEGNQRLYLSGYFERVDMDYVPAGENEMDVRIQVLERSTKYLKGSMGYGAETKERIVIGLEDRNFLGNARRLDVKATHSGFLTIPSKFRTTLLQAELLQPYLFGTNVEGLTSVSREYKERESYDSVGTTWKGSLGRHFGDYILASLRLRYEGTRVSNVTPEALEETETFRNIVGAGPSFNYDDTDDLFLPTNGWRLSGLYEQGLMLGIGDLRFYKTQFSAGRYTTFARHFTFAWGIQMGLIIPDDPLNPIPIYERFTLGGANTVRGYSERDLGPKDSRGFPLGGEAFGVNKLEFRFPLYKKIAGVTFLDAGQLWRRPEGTVFPHVRLRSTDDLQYGTGFGFRFQSPVGPIRLEFGYKLNPPAAYDGFEDRVEIHFSLGESF